MRVLLVLFESKAASVTAPTGALALTTFDRELQRAGVLLTHGRLAEDLLSNCGPFAGGRAPCLETPLSGDVDASPDSGLTADASAYWLLQVASRDEAVAWAARCPASAGARLAVWPVRDTADQPAG